MQPNHVFADVVTHVHETYVLRKPGRPEPSARETTGAPSKLQLSFCKVNLTYFLVICINPIRNYPRNEEGRENRTGFKLNSLGSAGEGAFLKRWRTAEASVS